MSTILLIGEDEFLLQTRAAVLRGTGADILCSDVASALSLLDKQVFDLVILCHSIASHVCETMVQIIRQNWPVTRVLQVSAVREWEQGEVIPGVDICSAEPERLIDRTVELLGRRKNGSVQSTFNKSSTGLAAGR
jgi:CheY-like chemotaxis protein